MIKADELVAKFQHALDNHWGYIWGKAGVLWTQALQDAMDKTTESKFEQARRYGKKWIGHTVADCSGLFSWAFKQLGGYMYHGSNTMWAKYCTNRGKLGDKAILPGTAVFTGTDTEKPHVGLYIGNGEVIEAAGTVSGVIKSKLTDKKWKYWGELKGVDYGASPQDEKPTLRKGSKGEYVVSLQTALHNRGYDLGKCGIDGDFGSATDAAVRRFQRDVGLTADGIVGRDTWHALETVAQPALQTVHIPGLTASQVEEVKKAFPQAYVD